MSGWRDWLISVKALSERNGGGGTGTKLASKHIRLRFNLHSFLQISKILWGYRRTSSLAFQTTHAGPA